MSTRRDVASGRRWGGWMATAGAAVFVCVALTLHAVQPGYDPAQQLMSELALGPHGGAMIAAFGGLAAAMAGIASAIGPRGASRVLQALLYLAGAFFLAAGIFPLGETSTIHIAAIAMAFIVSVLAMYLFPSLAGGAAQVAPRAISWTLAAGVAASAALGVAMASMGIGQRLAAACLLLWMFIVGWRLSRPRPGGAP